MYRKLMKYSKATLSIFTTVTLYNKRIFAFLLNDYQIKQKGFLFR